MDRHPSLDLSPGRLGIALFEPEIPGNAGNVARLCAATGSKLHLIGRLGFSLRHPDARRAAMDYWDRVETHRHIAWSDFRSSMAGGRVIAFSTRAEKSLWDTIFEPGDTLLFGPESRGLPDDILKDVAPLVVRIPMLPNERSLNIGTSAGIATYEALRQLRISHPA
jgi:tRNA (cytidine/uridine-2'-O-)-methyltransferase